MVYEIIGKMVLYVIGTLFFGAIPNAIDDSWGDDGALFFGAWLAGSFVFLLLIIQQTQ